MKKNKGYTGIVITFCILVFLGIIAITPLAFQSNNFFEDFGKFLKSSNKAKDQTDIEKSNTLYCKITSLDNSSLKENIVLIEDIYMIGNEIVVTDDEIEQAKKYYELSGCSKNKAEEMAIDYMGQYNALYVEAIKKGYSVTKEDIYEYLSSLKQFLGDAENKEDVQSLINEYGSEEEYWAYEYKVYQKSLPIQNYVANLESEFATQYNLEQGTEEFQQKWLDYFELYKKELMKKQEYVTIDQSISSSKLENLLTEFQIK